MPHTYILECSDGSYYVGSTWNLYRRFEEHATGHGAAYTRRRRPVTLVWDASFPRIDEAYAMEERIQGWSHRKRQTLIEQGPAALQGWSARERAKRVET